MMKRLLSMTVIAIMVVSVGYHLAAQENQDKQYKLSSENLDSQEKELDREIVELNKKIENAIKKYDLLNTKDIRMLPYQTEYHLDKDSIAIETHVFIRSNLYKGNIPSSPDIVGMRVKGIKIYTNGQTISKIESRIYEKYFNNDEMNEVIIVDPSPTTEGTDDILFTHRFKGKVLMENKKLGDVKNTTAFPVRSELKREFLVPNLDVFYNSIMFIAEAYYKSLKDGEENMSDFLKSAVK